MLSKLGRCCHKKFTCLFSIILVLSGATACDVLGEPEYKQSGPDPEPGDLLVLFIGSSYFAVNDMPGLFDRFAEDAGKAVYVRRDVISGNYLDYFAQSSRTVQVLQEQDWDYVVLQGGCQNAAYPDTHQEITPNSGYHPVYPALETLKAKVAANHSATKLVYMMPWAFEDGMTRGIIGGTAATLPAPVRLESSQLPRFISQCRRDLRHVVHREFGNRYLLCGSRNGGGRVVSFRGFAHGAG
jgi:hypothetical protein